MLWDVVRPAESRRRWAGAGLLAVPCAYLLLLFLLPLSRIAGLSVWDGSPTLSYFAQILSTPIYLDSLRWTLELAVVTSLLCLLLGYPVALAMANAGPRLRMALLVCIIMPFWISSLVRAFAWISILGRRGTINSTLMGLGVIDEPLRLAFTPAAVYIGTTHIMLPYMVLALYGVMLGIDRTELRAARSLGAGRLRAFFLIYVPQTMPGVISGLLLVFIITLGFFITPSVLGGTGVRPFVVLVERNMNQFLNWPMAAALSVSLLVPTLGLYFGFHRLIGLDRRTAASGAGVVASSRMLERVDRALRPLRGALRRLPTRSWRDEDGAAPLTLATAALIAAASAFPILLLVMH